MRDLGRFLIAQREKSDWAAVDTLDLEAFLAHKPRSRSSRRTAVRNFFRWAKAHRIVLVNPTTRLSGGRDRGFRGRTITVAEQRRLFTPWTTDPDAHPHEYLVGLLALLSCTPPHRHSCAISRWRT